MRRAYVNEQDTGAHMPSVREENDVPVFVEKILTRRTPASKTKAIRCENVQVEYRRFDRQDYICVWEVDGCDK